MQWNRRSCERIAKRHGLTCHIEGSHRVSYTYYGEKRSVSFRFQRGPYATFEPVVHLYVDGQHATLRIMRALMGPDFWPDPGDDYRLAAADRIAAFLAKDDFISRYWTAVRDQAEEEIRDLEESLRRVRKELNEAEDKVADLDRH